MKKGMLVVGFISLLLVSSVEAKQVGDFNDDGKINMLDLIEFLNHLSGNKDIEEIGQDISSSNNAVSDFTSVILPEITLGSEGENAPIDNNNVDDVHAILLRQIFDAWVDARDQIEDNVITTFTGPYSGKATFYGVLNGHRAYDFMNLEVLFEDYSRDGEIFISGKFHISRGVPYMSPPMKIDYIYLMGNCHIAGKYSGYMWYNCLLKEFYKLYLSYSGGFYSARKVEGGSEGFGAPIEEVDRSGWVIPDN